MKQIFTVTEINEEARAMLENFQVHVKGEVQEFNSSKAWFYSYLTLKDEESQISCVVSRQVLSDLDFDLAEGKEVIIQGQLSLYVKRGEYQLKVLSVEEVGEGKLQKQIEALKKKLQSEGLFDESRKKPLPRFPEKIAVVCSRNGAALKDFKKITQDRYPLAEIIVKDVFVQGDKCAKQVAEAINDLRRSPDKGLGVVVVTRGGGSLEDLMGYNAEKVARAIAASKIPVVTAIGHEKDVSIADLIADHRSSTPSNAAEDVVPSLTDLEQHIDNMMRTVDSYRARLTDKLAQTSDLITHIEQDFKQSLTNTTDRARSLLDRIILTSPEATLKRGYSLVYKKSMLVKQTKQIKFGDELRIRVKDGEIEAIAKEKKLQTEKLI